MISTTTHYYPDGPEPSVLVTDCGGTEMSAKEYSNDGRVRVMLGLGPGLGSVDLAIEPANARRLLEALQRGLDKLEAAAPPALVAVGG